MTTSANRLTPRATGATAGYESVATQPASQLRAFVDALDRLGFEVTSLLAHAGVRRSDLDDPDATIPCVALDRVLGAACEERRVPNLGARLGSVTPIGTYPLLDYLVVTTDTVGEALDQLVRYFHLADAPSTFAVVHDADAVRLLVQPGADAFIAQYETSLAVHHLRAETEHRIRVSCVSLMTEPDDVRDLELLLGCPVRAPSTWSGVEFPRDVLQVRLRRREPGLRRVLEGHAATVETRAPAATEHPTIAGVRAVLASQLGRGAPSVRAVARQLAVSPRTLQRRLAAEGVSYQQLIDLTRQEAAERLLADASLAVNEIGYLLGFSEPSAFHRAFKRWRNVTPQAYRSARKRSA
jgi:AraC-like DNA-binding protein